MANLPSLPARNPTGRSQDLDSPGLGGPPPQCPRVQAMHKGRGNLTMPQLQGPGGHWCMGEPVPEKCMTNALPTDDGMSVVWAPDL